MLDTENVPEMREKRELYFIEAPLQTCPLFEYCLIDAAYVRTVDLIVDVRHKTPVHLKTDRVQSALNLTYERVPAPWLESRSLPYKVARLMEGVLGVWPRGLPARAILVHSRKHRWWIDSVAEHCRVGISALRVERISIDGARREVFCSPEHCSLWGGLHLLQEVPQLSAAPGMAQLP